ncbi:CPBP family intramembrane glutamic endopeptidase [Chloroflexota bacterium]
MFDLVKNELGGMWFFLIRNHNEAIIICTAVLFLTLQEYHSFGARWSDGLFYYALLPLATIVILLRKNPLDFGLRLGNIRLWSIYVAITCIVAFPILLIASRFSSFEDYYTVGDFNLPTYFLKMVAYQGGWEFLFRGFLLFGLKERFKEGSIFIQMIPFLLVHFGKPEIEVISTIPMGVFFGYVAYRGNSYWPAFLIHLYINVVFRVLVNWL